MNTLRGRAPSPALLVAIIALVVAGAGTATAAALITSSNQVASGAINSGDLKNGKAVKLADLTPATKTKLTEAPPVEVFHEVGTAGEPGFQTSWVNFGPTTYDTAAFYKDPLGVVHLKGTVSGGAIGPIFTLPPGYRPAKSQFFPVNAANAYGVVLIRGTSEGVQAGRVHFNAGSNSFVSLDGITFRAVG